MSNQDGKSAQRDLSLDWSIDEIVDALSDELEFHLNAAELDPNSTAEKALIEQVLDEMGKDDAPTGDWVAIDKHRRLVKDAARLKVRASQQ